MEAQFLQLFHIMQYKCASSDQKYCQYHKGFNLEAIIPTYL